MQPVLEFSKLHDRSYNYSIRATRMTGVIPLACYVDRGHTSLAACVFDAAQALSVNFPRVYIRYEGACVGEADVRQLSACSEFMALKMVQEYERQLAMEAKPTTTLPAAASITTA